MATTLQYRHIYRHLRQQFDDVAEQFLKKFDKILKSVILNAIQSSLWYSGSMIPSGFYENSSAPSITYNKKGKRIFIILIYQKVRADKVS